MAIMKIGRRRGRLQLRAALLAFACGVTLVARATQPLVQPDPGPANIEATVARPLTGDEVVQRLVQRNEERARLLQHYTCKRQYSLVYHGFPSGREAGMEAEVAFDAPSTKQFKVISESGSKMLDARVLRKLLDSEKEAASDPARSAMTPANYAFQLLGAEAGPDGPSYMLQVTPKADNKFLYRGKIWVDATDFAVVKIDAEPAKNPSFWIKKTEIHHRYFKMGQFWLPAENETETHMRFGGVANLSIHYDGYEIGMGNRAAQR